MKPSQLTEAQVKELLFAAFGIPPNHKTRISIYNNSIFGASDATGFSLTDEGKMHFFGKAGGQMQPLGMWSFIQKLQELNVVS